MRMFLYLCFLFFIECANGDKLAWDVLMAHKETCEGSYCPDDEGEEKNQDIDIERPCLYQGLNCIRRYLEHHTGCSPKYGPAPDPFILYDLPLEVIHANVTVILKNAYVKGLNSGKVDEFYINKKTGTLVLELVFPSIVVDTPNTEVIYHLKGREPIKISYFTLVEFKSVSLTLTIQDFLDRSHKKRHHIYSYFLDPKPLYSVEPHLFYSQDSRIHKMNRQWLKGMALSGREAFLAQGPIYFAVFMNNVVCDLQPQKINTS